MSYTSLSCLCEETMKADARAFQKLMEHIQDIDREENTVVMMQVENETGILGSARENSDLADTMFGREVPEELVAYLIDHQVTLADDIKEEVKKGIRKGNWKEVFGEVAEELFTAYYSARYVNYVAKAGIDVYPLHMAVNAWLSKGGKPGEYPSGGPVARVMEVWKHAAPQVDIFAPDIYVPTFCEVCEEYTKLDNPLFIPEVANHAYAGIREIYVIGRHHAMCYSPFGIEDLGEAASVEMGELMGIDVSDPTLKLPQNIKNYAKINAMLVQLMPLLTSKYGTKDLQAIMKEKKEDSMMVFGKYGIKAIFDIPFIKSKEGACLAIKISENEFMVLASGCVLAPVSLDENLPFVDILSIEEGHIKDGKWHMLRRWDGDEVLMFKIEEPLILKIKLSAEYNVHAVQINFADDELFPPLPECAQLRGALHQERWIDETSQPTKCKLEGSFDGKNYFVIEDKSGVDTNLPHDLIVKEKGIKARYIKLIVVSFLMINRVCIRTPCIWTWRRRNSVKGYGCFVKTCRGSRSGCNLEGFRQRIYCRVGVRTG